MNLNNIYVGMVVKNYKVMCELLNEKIKRGKSRQLQIKDWTRYFTFKQDVHKLIVVDIFDTPLGKIDMRGKAEGIRNNKEIPQFKIPNELWKSSGIYAITLNNDIYIGSTNAGFRKRFFNHRSKFNKFVTKQMIDNGAIFEILEITNDLPESELRQLEQSYYNSFKNNKKWNVVNSQNPFKIKLSKKYRIKKMTLDKIKKPKYKKISVLKENYDKAIELLTINNLI